MSDEIRVNDYRVSIEVSMDNSMDQIARRELMEDLNIEISAIFRSLSFYGAHGVREFKILEWEKIK